MSKESTEEAIQDTSEEKELSTDRQLFPDLLPPLEEEKKEKKEEEKVIPDETAKTVETETKTEEPPEARPEPTETKYLSLEEFGNHVVKLKVGGEEQEVPFKDVIRGTQTDKYLTQKGQQLAEQFKQLEKAKDGLIDKSKGAEVKASPEDEYGTDLPEASSTEVMELKQQIAILTNNLSSITATLAPTVYEQEIKSIDAYLKSQGYDDFMEHRAEIESYFNTLTVEQRAVLTEGDVVNKYKDLKIAKMVKAQAEAAAKPVEERKAPTVVNINAGGGPPSGGDDYDAKYAKAMAKAQETQDFTEVLGLKGCLRGFKETN